MIYIGILIVVVVQQPPQPEPVEVPPEGDRSEPEHSGGSGAFKAICKQCGWHNSYPTYSRSLQGLGAHRYWCRRRGYRVSPFLKP